MSVCGSLDLYVGEWRPYAAGAGELSGSRLLRNLGASAPCSFEDATEAAGVSLEQRTPSLLLRATRAYPYPEPGREDESDTQPRADGTMVQTIANGIFTFSPAFVDLDGDGWLDLAVTGDFSTSVLFFNNGDATFGAEVSAAVGVGKEENGMGSTLMIFH